MAAELVDGESRTDAKIYSGRTPSGKLVHFAADESDIGHFRYVKIERADAYALHGSLLPDTQ